MSALKPVLLSLYLILLRFLQSRLKQFRAHVTKHVKPADSDSIVCNGKYGCSENPVSLFRAHCIPLPNLAELVALQAGWRGKKKKKDALI